MRGLLSLVIVGLVHAAGRGFSSIPPPHVQATQGVSLLLILASSGRAWLRALRGERVPLVAAPAGPSKVSGPDGCC